MGYNLPTRLVASALRPSFSSTASHVPQTQTQTQIERGVRFLSLTFTAAVGLDTLAPFARSAPT